MAEINPNVLAIALAGASKLFRQPGVKGEGIDAAANLAIGLGQQGQKNALLAQMLNPGAASAIGEGAGITESTLAPGSTPMAGLDETINSAVNMDDLKQKLLLNALSNIGASPFL